MPTSQASGLPPSEWSVLAHRRGVPWWGAIAVAVGLAVLGVAVDLVRGDTLTRVFLVLYVLGCLAAVLAVRQRSLFAAMVQPPLVLAVAVPLVVLALGSNTDGSTRSKVIAMVLPLVNGFPTMAFATLAAVGIGVARILVRRRSHPAHTGRPPARRKAPARPGPRPGPDGRRDPDDRGDAARRAPSPAPRRDTARRDDARRDEPRRDDLRRDAPSSWRRDERGDPGQPAVPARAGRHDATRVGPARRGARPVDPRDAGDRREPREARPRRARRDSAEDFPPLPGDRLPRRVTDRASDRRDDRVRPDPRARDRADREPLGHEPLGHEPLGREPWAPRPPAPRPPAPRPRDQDGRDQR